MAYKIKWKPSDISFVLVDDITSDPVVTVEISTPGGTMLVMGEPREVGRLLIVERVHISSDGIAPNTIGIANLRLVASVVMEAMDYDVICFEGEVRTTGANPARRPRPVRFTRMGDDPAGR